MLSDDEIDTQLNKVLRASGSQLSYYSMQSTLSGMRTAMREFERAVLAKARADEHIGAQLYEEMQDAIHQYVVAKELPASVIESWELIFQHWLDTKAMPAPKRKT
jgi:hypothetical protein